MEYVPGIITGMLLLFIITRPFTIFFHELGHAIPFILLTKKGATIFIGSYGEEKHSIKFRLGKLQIWIKYNPVRWKGGLCVPKADDIPLSKWFISILGGPVLSVVFASILCCLTFAFDLHGAIKLACVFAVGSSIFDLISNLIPGSFELRDGRKIYTDGYKLLRIYKLQKFPKEYDIAIAVYNQKNFHKSASLFQNFINLGVENEEVYRLAYTSHIFIKEYENAYELLKEFERKYQLNSDDYCNYGLINIYLKLTEDKIWYFEKSLELNPDNPYALNSMGYILNAEYKFPEAIPYLDKAISIMPELAYAYNNRGHAKIELGKLEEGVMDINYSLQLDKENPYAYRNLGIYYLKINQPGEARRLFLKAKEMDGKTEMIDQLLEKVEN